MNIPAVIAIPIRAVFLLGFFAYVLVGGAWIVLQSVWSVLADEY